MDGMDFGKDLEREAKRTKRTKVNVHYYCGGKIRREAKVWGTHLGSSTRNKYCPETILFPKKKSGETSLLSGLVSLVRPSQLFSNHFLSDGLAHGRFSLFCSRKPHSSNHPSYSDATGKEEHGVTEDSRVKRRRSGETKKMKTIRWTNETGKGGRREGGWTITPRLPFRLC